MRAMRAIAGNEVKQQVDHTFLTQLNSHNTNIEEHIQRISQNTRGQTQNQHYSQGQINQSPGVMS